MPWNGARGAASGHASNPHSIPCSWLCSAQHPDHGVQHTLRSLLPAPSTFLGSMLNFFLPIATCLFLCMFFLQDIKQL